MEQANIILTIGGATDSGYQVPKFGVTAAEIKLLQAIHGDESVTDVEPLDEPALNTDDEPRTQREELARLSEVYRQARVDDGNGSQRLVIQTLFPLASALPKTIDDLDLDESFFKPVKRAKADKAEAKKASKAGKARGAAETREATEQPVSGDETQAFN